METETPEQLGDIAAVPPDFQSARLRPTAAQVKFAERFRAPGPITGAWVEEAASLPDFDLPHVDASGK